jgi:hypothetical protein
MGGKTKIYRNSFKTVLTTKGGYLMNNLNNRANIIASIVSGDLLSDFDLLMEDEGFRSKFKKYVKNKSISIEVATEDLVFYANENLT